MLNINLKSSIVKLKTHKTSIMLAAVLSGLILGTILTAQKILYKLEQLPTEEIDLSFDPEGSYAVLEPRDDGNALILNIRRVSSYEAITYELTYQSEGIDRGVQGSVETKGKKSEYTQEILFGTCSQGFTSGATHCVFDKNVENGTLTLKIRKPQEKEDKTIKVYKMIVAWHLQKPDVALGKISSADNHFIYQTKDEREKLSKVGWSIVNDLSGLPKLPKDKTVAGKAYAFNVPAAKSFPAGNISIELPYDVPKNAQLVRWNENKSSWDLLASEINGSKIAAEVHGAGIFAVFSPLDQ